MPMRLDELLETSARDRLRRARLGDSLAYLARALEYIPSRDREGRKPAKGQLAVCPYIAHARALGAGSFEAF